MSTDPIHQFQINPIFELPAIAGVDTNFTNASLFMLVATGATAAFFYWAMKPAALVPGRAQVVAETGYQFVHGMVRDAAGDEGVKRFLPFVFTLFLWIFAANLIGLFPYFFTPTSHVIVTATMALMVFVTVIVVGIAKNGVRFLKLFFPSGLHPLLYLFVTPIEILSFFSRPLSHAVRLWANIFAGHLLLKVIAGFVPALVAAGIGYGILSIVPLAMTVAIYALEFLVAFLQAYVFAILTCIYLNDALHPGH